MNDFKKIQPIEFKNFIENSAKIVSAAKIYSDGIQYVDNASFFQWITQSYPNSQFIDSAESMKQFLDLHGNQLKGIRSLVQGKGLEWDVFRDYHPHFMDINKLPLDTTAPVADINSYNPFSGINLDIQVKTSLANPVAIAKDLLSYPENTKFAVNQSVYDKAIELGIPKERFVKVVSDEQVKSVSEQRMNDASTGNVDVGVSLEGALREIGKGAVIGAVLYVGVSAISNYRKYKSGQMSYDEFAERLLKDGAKGGIMGGTMSAVNVGVQWSLVQLGLGAGNPIAIPVMIVISYGLKKIIDPMFKDGSYAETLSRMKYYDDMGKGWLDFGRMSSEMYTSHKRIIKTLEVFKERSIVINNISNVIDNNLDSIIKEI